MAQTKAGGLKCAQTNRQRYGADFYRRIGRKGGMVTSGYAFGYGKVDPSVIGKIGGKSSRVKTNGDPWVELARKVVKSRMTDQEIVIKATNKAIANGFDIGKAMGHRRPNDGFELYTDPRLTYWTKYENGEGMVYWLIFNHDFAKALWGKIKPHPLAFTPVWKFHLQEMVIADDPIAYLGENL